MKNRGPIDFLAALIVEFGGLALLLAALSFLGGLGGGSIDEKSALHSQPAHLPPLPWPRAGNPTPWDDQAVDRQSRESDPDYVEQRLRSRGEKLIQGLFGGIEQFLEDR